MNVGDKVKVTLGSRVRVTHMGGLYAPLRLGSLIGAIGTLITYEPEREVYQYEVDFGDLQVWFTAEELEVVA